MAAPPPPSPGPQTGTRHTTSGIIALVFGIVQFVGLPVIGAIVALVAGYSSRNEARNNPELSDELGRVGRILGWVGIALTILLVLGVLAFLVVIRAV